MRLRTRLVHGWWIQAWLAFSIVITMARPGDAEEPGQVRLAGRVVDEADSPVANVTVLPNSAGVALDPVQTDARGNFQLTVPLARWGLIYGSFLARAADGRLGFLSISLETPEPLTIRIKPARALEVRVLDRDRKPIAGAEVGFLANFAALLDGRTDTEGRWRVMVPADLPIHGIRMLPSWCVYALKAKAGFDYAVSDRARGSVEAPLPLPERLTLTLDGARAPVRIRTVDRDGNPLAGVKIRPWIFRKPGQEREANLGGATRTSRMTGNDGVAVFDWFPAEIQGPIEILSDAPNSYAPDGAVGVSAKASDDDVTIARFPYEQLSGRVLTPEGRPAAGATVALAGHGAGRSPFRSKARTDADGRYAVQVYSEQAYILTASLGEMAATSRSEVIVRAGKPVEGVDLVLGRATRVRGRLTSGPDQKPIANARVMAVIDKGKIPAELERKGTRGRFIVMYTFDAYTDPEGRFEFRLGPGDYEIRVATSLPTSRIEPIPIAITAEAAPQEIVRDIHVKAAEPTTVPFRATVVDTEGHPVAGAEVTGMYAARVRQEWIKRSNDQGIVTLPRWSVPMIVYAQTSDRRLAGLAHVGAEQTDARLIMKATASASGRLVDAAGKPIASREIEYETRLRRSLVPRGSGSAKVGGVTTTDDQGRFRLPALVAEEPYQIFVHILEEGRASHAASKITASAGESLELGDVTIDLGPPRPYVPPTPAERSAASFVTRIEVSPREKAARVIADARLEYARPLILFGKPTDPECIDLFRLLDEPAPLSVPVENQSPSALRGGFALLSLDTTDAGVVLFAKQLGLAGAGKVPALATLSDDGTLAGAYPLQTVADGKLDPSALAAFLRGQKLPTRDARRLLAEGLAKAKAEEKRVFLIFSGIPCAPCLSLARFVSANRAELERHYVFVTVYAGRDEHGLELDQRYRGDNDGGVPWYAILDAAGTRLITSNSPEQMDERGLSNIGFPSSPTGINHLMKMFRETAPRLSAEALATLREGVTAKP